MRVLVCGGRDFDDMGLVWGTLDAFHALRARIDVLIHGGATGADALAAAWASYNEIGTEVFHADWKRHGRAGGPIRNERMLAVGRPDLVIAFPGGDGTKNMVGLAREAGIEVEIITKGNEP